MGEIEKIENIELMRALENNLKLGTFVVKGSDLLWIFKQIFLGL